MSKTVKVRIAVAVDRLGNWNSCGWPATAKDHEGDMMALSCETVEPGEARFWITAELPIPEVKEVAGEVEREDSKDV